MAWKFIFSIFGFELFGFEVAKIPLVDEDHSSVALGMISEVDTDADEESNVPYGFSL